MSSPTRGSKDLTADMPPEVLAHVFGWLHFLDRVRVACVSRYWRSTALQFPALWADIRLLDGRRKQSLVHLTHLALSRSGRHPVDLECGTEFTAHILREHLDHIRTLLWVGLNMDCLTSPAPMLEVFRCATSIPFPPNFLGGQVGVLRTLELRILDLPPACPALASVTSLRTETENVDLAPMVNRLWKLCPLLETLHLRDLPAVGVSDTDPPPVSLARLRLRTSSPDCNVCQFVDMCMSPSLKEVRIELQMQATLSLSSYMRSALELSIEQGDPRREGFVKSSTALLPNGCTMQLFFTDSDEGHRSDLSVEKVLEEGSTFPGLHTLTMPLLIFHLFIRKRPHFPALEHLRIIVQQEPSGANRFDWTRIYCLAFLRHYAVATVTIDVRYLTPVEDKLSDARTLVTHILQHAKSASSDAMPDSRYVVRGFPPEVARALNDRCCEPGHRITFESAEQ
ncbi:hypothetical protein AURDEDRAFT_188955 [Auricularia subglabra TFB-10046 SS5]|uniref:F-box domain-containing protein n=1 Tax=Auricularia subglabra (strain TFB-10046 / SS5) TaxID=717982 RepID=J0WRP5_AURST|nr:hypothetical protein AURDEDRAFT_188955 [Auricularia subglabra TFB-10046 SS5]